MYMMVIDGRRSGTASGMTRDEVRDLAVEFNCWDAAMLDGGGSSTKWVDGRVRNVPSDGSERTRPNHIGIVVKPSADAECTPTRVDGVTEPKSVPVLGDVTRNGRLRRLWRDLRRRWRLGLLRQLSTPRRRRAGHGLSG